MHLFVRGCRLVGMRRVRRENTRAIDPDASGAAAEMIPEADIERARARWDVIAADVALKRRGRELVGLCPFHAERSPSFCVTPDKGFFHCFGCGAHGTAIDYVMRTRSLDFAAAVRELLGMPERPAKVAIAALGPTPIGDSEVETQGLVNGILAGCGPVQIGTAARLYLMTRGLKPDQPALLAHPALYCHEIMRAMPALVAPITNSAGDVTAVQRIWCTTTLETVNGVGPSDSRAPLDVRKKTLGHMRDGAVRLRPAGARLGLAEGVETSVAASMLFRHPVWAVCGAARLGRVWLPPEVDEVIVFGDNGDTGRTLADRACELIDQRGIAASAVFPDPEYGDFCDQLIGRRG